MSKTEALNRLFEKWESDVNYIDDTLIGKFVRDGIIDESEFDKQSIKVLFISNEANCGKDHRYENEWDEPLDRRANFLDYYKNDKDWTGRLRERVSCLYQVITNDYSQKAHEVANRFAFMNLNKNGGEATCNIEHIEKYCMSYKNYIKKEIEIINPDIIVWLACNTFDSSIPEQLGIDTETATIELSKKVPVIRMWHTSFWQVKRKPQLNVFKNRSDIKYPDLIDCHAYKLYQELKQIHFFEQTDLMH